MTSSESQTCPCLQSLISHCQCFAGFAAGALALPDIGEVLTQVPFDLEIPERFVVRIALGRVLAHVANGLQTIADASPMEAFVTWAGTDASSDEWRAHLSAVVGVLSGAQTRASAQPAVPAGRTIDLRIRRALHEIDERYAECDLSLRDIAHAATLSSSHTARLLTEQTGWGFVAHLHERRLAATRAHLSDSTLSIKEVAARVGYRSTSELGRHFKRAMGMTPREYRESGVFSVVTAGAQSHDE